MKIPPSAKVVFKGEIFDVYQWEQEMFDGSKKTFEMLKRPASIITIAVQEDKIFMSKQEQPQKGEFYSLFGGRPNENEEYLVAAKRELLEESGLVSDDWEEYKRYNPSTKIDHDVVMYIAHDCKKIQDPQLDNGERIETLKVSLDEFIEIVTTTRFRGIEFVADVLRMKLEQKLMEEFKQKLFKEKYETTNSS
jgi:ADP-ribose pyrophosphatase